MHVILGNGCVHLIFAWNVTAPYAHLRRVQAGQIVSEAHITYWAYWRKMNLPIVHIGVELIAGVRSLIRLSNDTATIRNFTITGAGLI